MIKLLPRKLIYRNVSFLYTNNELSEIETKKKFHSPLHQNRIKYLGINLSKEVKGKL